jgi:hypothetical protein
MRADKTYMQCLASTTGTSQCESQCNKQPSSIGGASHHEGDKQQECASLTVTESALRLHGMKTCHQSTHGTDDAGPSEAAAAEEQERTHMIPQRDRDARRTQAHAATKTAKTSADRRTCQQANCTNALAQPLSFGARPKMNEAGCERENESAD